MKVCIIGDGLTSLSLAKNLINKKISVDIYHEKKKNISTDNRMIGISKNNFDFFINKIQDIKKNSFWEVNKIEIYSEKTKDHKILDFEKDKNELFFMIKNNELYQSLKGQLLKSKIFKKKIITDNSFYEKLLNKKKYYLIINCNSHNFISKNFFSKKIDKNYSNIAYTLVITHLKLTNNTAIQIFTRYGPIAFLPISETKTSIVYSLETKRKFFSEKKVFDLIKKYNPKFSIKKFSKLESFELKSSNLRNYYHKNILAFGDCLHRIHPLAGQGFNMTIRDIKDISKIIQSRIDLGIQLDQSILEEFEKKTKHTNFIFSNGIDFIYEIFNLDKDIKNENLSKVLKLFGKNKSLNSFFVKFADRGLRI